MEFLSNNSSSPTSESHFQEPNNLTMESVIATANEQQPPASALQEETYTPLFPRLDLKRPILSSSSSESDPEEATNPPAVPTSTEATGGERVPSPPPNCAICLGRCKNKCFTDSCMHQFCFKCLCEWSKVKPECPLCKQTFKSIIHNVKSKDQFEEYHVPSPTVQIAHPQFEMDFPQMRIFGVVHQNLGRSEAWNDRVHRPLFIYPSGAGNAIPTAAGNAASGSSRATPIGSLRNQYVYRGELLDLYRQEYPEAIANSGTLSQLWRRYVYDRKLYALPVCDAATGRFRESSAQYYRDNPALIHRLVPWINRDLQCLLRQTQHDTTAVLENINTALSLMNILSPAFRRRLQNFLGNKTAHFIHELNNFARSPYDMNGYDRVVEYSPQSNEDVVIEFTSSDDSSDNDEIDVANDSGLATSANAALNAINLTIHNRLTSLVGRVPDTSSNGTTRSAMPDDVSLVIDLRGDPEDTSPASVNENANPGSGENAMANQPSVSVAENIELTSGSSDECEFVLERKPPHLRTPEMVSLDSASDSDVVFVDESKPLSKTTFSTSEGEDNEESASGRSKRPTTRSKIVALVEAKKRSLQSANLVKNESKDSSDVYNVGASTSAALRLSIQQRSDRSRSKRSKYSLRNARSVPDQNEPRRRGKRFPSESSHSSSSVGSSLSASSCSKSASDDLATSGSSSDEDFIASAAQKWIGNPRKRKRMRKSKKAANKSTSKRDCRKRRRHNDEESCDDGEDNGHLGKNFALVMAIGERLKRQKDKLKKSRAKANTTDEDEGGGSNKSGGENSWRLKAVNEPLRKQQLHKVQAAAKSNEHKRRARNTLQKSEQNSEQLDDCGRPEGRTSKHDGTSSDESDNLKLIELKSKLTRKCSNEGVDMVSNTNSLEEDTPAESRISQNEHENVSCSVAETPQSPTIITTETYISTMHEASSTDEGDHGDDDDHHEVLSNQPQDFVDHNLDIYNPADITDTLQGHEEDPNQNVYCNEDVNVQSPMDHEEEEEDRSSATLNIPTSVTLSHEPNVFDGASMSTTTTDTILNDAADQISSAAVNFYNPQQTFNTAVFAEDNSSNSSSSESSVSSTTTTTSSSNSNSSNTNGFMNYDLS